MAFGTYSAAVAALTIGSTVYSGIEQHQANKRARQQQEKVQASARNQALAQRQQSQAALNRANARTPDPAELLAAASLKQQPSSILAGTSNSALSVLQLNRLKKLGE